MAVRISLLCFAARSVAPTQSHTATSGAIPMAVRARCSRVVGFADPLALLPSTSNRRCSGISCEIPGDRKLGANLGTPHIARGSGRVE
jgi:hypothetical protein